LACINTAHISPISDSAPGDRQEARPPRPDIRVVVPGGTFKNVVTPPFPDGFNAKDGQAGVTFSGRAFGEPKLIGLAYAFDQATHFRTPPSSAPPLRAIR
jgi:hypothetical protein